MAKRAKLETLTACSFLAGRVKSPTRDDLAKLRELKRKARLRDSDGWKFQVRSRKTEGCVGGREVGDAYM